MSSFNQRGQTLVEYLIVKIILIFISFAVIEIARLYAFKSYLQILTHEFVVKLSNRHLELMKNNLFYKQNNMNNYQKKIESEAFQANTLQSGPEAAYWAEHAFVQPSQ